MRYGLIEGDSHMGKTRDMLDFLVHHGFIKPPERKRGTYKITKKGKQFLKAIESFFNMD
jgi:predicted transcriptional regulator